MLGVVQAVCWVVKVRRPHPQEPRCARREAVGASGVAAISVHVPNMIEHIFYSVKRGNGQVRCVETPWGGHL